MWHGEDTLTNTETAFITQAIIEGWRTFVIQAIAQLEVIVLFVVVFLALALLKSCLCGSRAKERENETTTAKEEVYGANI